MIFKVELTPWYYKQIRIDNNNKQYVQMLSRPRYSCAEAPETIAYNDGVAAFLAGYK